MSLIRTFILLSLISLLSLPGPGAHAHGDLSQDEDVCKLRLGPHLIHFTGYQPKQRLGQEFCEDIPVTGQTIMVFDAETDKLRPMTIAVRIVEDVGKGSAGDENARPIATAGPEAFADGTISLEHDFPEEGTFVGIVTVEMPGNPDPAYVGRFPFSVGVGNGFRRQIIQLVVLVSLLGGGFYFLSGYLETRRRRRTHLQT